MPNWTEQQLHVVGKKTDIDRFLRVGYTPRRKGDLDALLQFDELCPKPPHLALAVPRSTAVWRSCTGGRHTRRAST